MFFNGQKEDNVITVVCRTLSLFEVKVTPYTVKRYLKPHPDYPSLKSVCDLFREIRVDCYPLRISDTELFSLKEPFIAHLNEGAGKIILVRKVDNDKITYTDTPVGWEQISTEQFLTRWSRVVLLPEPSEISGEKDFAAKRKDALVTNSIIPCLIFLFVVICGYGLGSDGYCRSASLNPGF
jgi:ABC-type bacteriocin/lantibiotic exporter with double-glycine peptidase domain